MIEAKSPFAALAAQLTSKAEALANARSVTAALKSRETDRHWRDARLIWPLFGKG